MVFGKQKRASLRLALVMALLVGIYGLSPMPASAEKAVGPVSGEKDCDPNGGWMWTDGPSQPDVANQVRQELAQKGIRAQVETKGYGETNSCGDYHSQGVDFTIQLTDSASTKRSSQAGFTDELLPILKKHGKPGLGNVKLISSEGKVIPTSFQDKLSTSSELGTQT